MQLLKDILNWIGQISDTAYWRIAEFVSMVSWFFGIITIIVARVKIYFDSFVSRALILLLVTSGQIIPIINLLISNWSDPKVIVRNCVEISVRIIIMTVFFYLIKRRRSEKNAIQVVETETAGPVEIAELSKENDVMELHNKEIIVGLEKIRFNKKVYKTSLYIGSPQYEEMIIKNKKAGFSVVYTCGDTRYRVRILKANAKIVLVQVAKL